MTSVALVRGLRLRRTAAKAQQPLFFAQLISSCRSFYWFSQQQTFRSFMGIFGSATCLPSLTLCLTNFHRNRATIASGHAKVGIRLRKAGATRVFEPN